MTGIQYLLIDINTSDQTIQPLYQMHPYIATHLLTRYFIAYSDGEHERGGVSDKLL